MEKQSQWCDICVVCALPEESEAFLEMVEKHYETLCERKTYDHSKYDYWLAAIKNEKDELLTLHTTFPSRYGPNEMVSFLTRVLDENQPRIVIMTGICAGDSHQVQLGDLVVAERTFTYDGGKFIQDEHGKQVHLHDTLTYSMDENILQFLGIFNTWKPLIARLKLPTSPSERNNSMKEPLPKHKRKIARHLKAMASGTAVRADNPFVDVRIPVRNAVAIDMEGAAVGLVMKQHPLVPWLIVKGVCDFADPNKADGFHEYAARASALYALSFIRAYVTNERLPRREEHQSQSRAGPLSTFEIPYHRNPFFTGQEELLELLLRKLAEKATALTQAPAISGLGGIGKTQIALEYAYRYRDRYRYTFWVNAATESGLLSELVSIASLLELPEKDELDQYRVALAVKQWLESHDRWLLIFDNADDIALVSKFLPREYTGHILLTTRAQATGSYIECVDVALMDWNDGTLLLLRRAKLVPQNASFEHAAEVLGDQTVEVARNIVVILGQLPLALDQAAAYIEEQGCSLATYLKLYQEERKELLDRRGTLSSDGPEPHPESVVTTWSLSFQKIEQSHLLAADLLRFCAFLDPDAIPEEIIRADVLVGSKQLVVEEFKKELVGKELKMNDAIGVLRRYSLVKRNAAEQKLSMHRLVQAVLQDSMNEPAQRYWAERVVRAAKRVFPSKVDITTWSQCKRVLAQAQICSTHIETYHFEFAEAANLLHQASLYLHDHALYSLAESLCLRALAIRQQVLGEEHPETAQSFYSLATLYYTQGQYRKAEPLYQRALSICERVLGPADPNTAQTLNHLALLYKAQGRYPEAEPLFQRALSIYEQTLGLNHLYSATCVQNLALLYKAQGRYPEAEPLFQRALSIYEQMLGPNRPEIATCLNDLALFYKAQGRYPEAKPLFQRALSIYEQTLGPNHPEIATCLNNLASLLDEGQDHSHYAESEAFYQRALSIRQRVLGEKHPGTATILNNLALLYKAQGRYSEAEPLFQRALSILKHAQGSDHPEIATYLNNLAELYRKQGRDDEAELLLLRALSILKHALGPNHPSTAFSLNNLALLYGARGQHAKALQYSRQTTLVLKEQLGPNHPSTKVACQNYEALLKQAKSVPGSTDESC